MQSVRFVLLVAFASIFPNALAAATAHETRMVAAADLGAKDSWSEARDAYAEALRLAPSNADSQRWVRLRLADATWRAEAVTRAANQGANDLSAEEWHQRNETILSAFVGVREPDSSIRDDFQALALEFRADLADFSGQANPWLDRTAIAEYLGGKPPSADAAARFVAFLERCLSPVSIGEQNAPVDYSTFTVYPIPPVFLGLVDQAVRVATHSEDRAWLAIQYARNSRFSLPDEVANRWTRALTLSQGTRWLPAAKAAEFDWRARAGRDATADYRPRLAELESALRGLDPGSTDPLITGLRKSLEDLQSSWNRRRLRLSFPEVADPGEPIRFSYGANGFRSLGLRLFRLDPQEWILRNQPLRPGGSPPRTPVRSWDIELSDPANNGWNAGVEEIPPLEPGFYILMAHPAGPMDASLNREFAFVVTSASVVGRMRPRGAGTLYLFNRADGSPIARASVAASVGDRGWGTTPTVWRNWFGVTDESGRVDLTPGDAGFDPGSVVALVDGQPVWFNYYTSSIREDQLYEIVLDRPLYRPGETVRWKVIARELKDGRLTVPTRDLALNISLNGSDLVENQPLEFNAFGTASGELVLSPTARPGWGRIDLKDEREQVIIRGSGSFDVDNFVPPAVSVQLSLASGRGSLRPGQEVVIRVKSEFLSGGPAAGLTIESRFSISEIGVPSWISGRPGLTPKPLVEIEETPVSFEYYQWSEKIRIGRTVVTDANGIAELRLQLPDDMPEFSTLIAGVVAIPDGGQSVVANRDFAISNRDFHVDSGEWTVARLARPGDEIAFKARVVDGAGEPGQIRGRARLVERRWIEAWVSSDGRIVSGEDLAGLRRDLRLAPDDAPPSDWRKIDRIETAAHVAEVPVQSATDGSVAATFKVPREGFFQVQFLEGAVPLAFIQSEIESLSVVAADENTRTLALSPTVTRIFGPETVRPGQPLSLFLLLPEGKRHAVVALEGEENETVRRIELPGRAGLVQVGEVPPALTSVQVEIAIPGVPSSGAETTLQVNHTPDRLAIQLEPMNDQPSPGDESGVRVRVLDSQGRPARAEIVLGGSDEAIHQMADSGIRDGIRIWDLGGNDLFSDFESMPSSVEPPLRPRDPRPGAWREDPEIAATIPTPGSLVSIYSSNPYAGGGIRAAEDDEDVVMLNPFMIAQEPAGLGFMSKQDKIAAAFGQGLADPAEIVRGDADQPDSRFSGIRVRQRFASTILWAPSVVTDERGEAVVPITYADNLTRWRIEAHATGEDPNTFGRSTTFTRTSLPLQSRLQLPRFLVAGDTAETSALLVNRTDRPLPVSIVSSVSGAVTRHGPPLPSSIVFPIDPQGNATVPMPVKADAAGKAVFSIAATASGSEGDAMVAEIPVLEDGIQQLTAATGRLASGARSQSLTLALPSRLDRNRTQVSVQLSPSYAAAILDALPYLIEFPYGCVEQTLNRFLPAVVVRKTLTDLGLDPIGVERRILPAESPADAARRARTAGLGRLDAVVQDGFLRLDGALRRYEFGFGWWPDSLERDAWMTAYVLWGSVLAREAGLKLPPGMEEIEDNLATVLESRLDERTKALTSVSTGPGIPYSHYNDGSLALLVASGARIISDRDQAEPELIEAFDQLYAVREKLPAAGQACLLLASAKMGTPEQRAALLSDLRANARRAPAPGLGNTVHWGETANYWQPMNGAVEATSLSLLALLAVDPRHTDIEPAANWLLLNRRSSHWDSTRSTSFAVLALARYIEVRQEAQPDAAVELRINGRVAGRVAFSRDSLLENAAPIAIDPALLRGGNNRIELVRTGGTTPVYVTALGSSWAPAEAVRPAGNLFSVTRALERLKPQPSLIGSVQLVPQSLPASGSVIDGEQVTAIVRLSVPNDLEYVMVEVPKPAGCEPLNALSGWDASLARVGPDGTAPHDPRQARPVYREERDDRSVFFLDRIEAGSWEIRFTMRATTAGDFRVLPAVVTAMYVPEVRANSDARRLRIEPKRP